MRYKFIKFSELPPCPKEKELKELLRSYDDQLPTRDFYLLALKFFDPNCNTKDSIVYRVWFYEMRAQLMQAENSWTPEWAEVTILWKS